MEPFIFITNVLMAAASGVIGNRADKVLCTVMHTVTERLRKGELTENNDLQRAVYLAYHQATFTVCEEYRKELARLDPRIPMHPKEFSWIKDVESDIQEKIAKISQINYLPPTNNAVKQVELLLKPKSAVAEQRVNELRVTLRNGLLSELRESHAELPVRFREMVEEGWYHIEINGCTVHYEWFDLLCACFGKELKTNKKLQSIFESGLLAELIAMDIPSTLQSLQAQYEKLGKLSDEKLEDILRELRRRPLYERYTGIEVANSVENLVNEYTTLFVGREKELAKLDAFLVDKPCGVMTITAKAGFGKSALLANWIAARKGEGYFFAYHFFNNRNDATIKVNNAYRNLLRQILIYYEIADEPLPIDKQNLRDMLIGILTEHKTNPDEPLVIILDGLDEAEQHFSPPFPIPLLDGVYVIVSARADEGEIPKYLHNWTEGATPLYIPRFSRGAIAGYVQRAEGGELEKLAADLNFIKKLEEKTEGFPLYLRFMTEELVKAKREGQDVWAKLEQTPGGFEEYVYQQLLHLEELDRPEQVWNFFALLAVAKGVLSYKEIKVLTGMQDQELRKMHQTWQVTRWLIITGGGKKIFYRFAHHLLGETFSVALGDGAEEAQEKILTYCSRWKEHSSPYALQHYAEHLLDVAPNNFLTTLYSLARDEGFRSAQAKVFPEDPYLSLRTLQMALQGAADSDDPPAMAEFLLMNAKRLEYIITQESPLQALRVGDLQRAWKIADLLDLEHCVLWHLLLTWELKDTHRLKEAQATLEHLQEKELFHLSDWRESYAADLLTQVFEVDENTIIALHLRLLSEGYKVVLCRNLSDRLHFAIALEIAKGIETANYRADALRNIAAAQAQAGDFPAALETAKGIEDVRDHSKALRDIVAAQAQAGDFPAALETTKGIEDVRDRSKASRDIATAQAQAGQIEEARTMLSAAFETAKGIEDVSDRADVLRDIAVAQAQVGDFPAALETTKGIQYVFSQAIAQKDIATAQVQAGQMEEARTTFSTALETLKGVNGTCWYQPVAYALSDIATAQAQVDELLVALETVNRIDFPGDFETTIMVRAEVLRNIAATQAKASRTEEARNTYSIALEIAKGIEYTDARVNALRDIAAAQAQACDFPAALETAKGIEDMSDRSKALGDIAVAQAQACDYPAALETAKGIEDVIYRDYALRDIAAAQAQAGQIEEARTTFSAALETAKGIEGVIDRSKALRDIAAAQAQACDYPAALETAKGIEVVIYQVEALRDIAAAQAQAGQIEEARTTLSVALDTAEGIINLDIETIIRTRTKALRDIAAAQAQVGDFSAAFETIKRIKDPFYRMLYLPEALRDIAAAQAQANEFSLALETAKGIKDVSYRAEALRDIVAAQAQVGDFHTALETTQGIEDSRYRAEALRDIAVAQARVGFNEKAVLTAETLFIDRNIHLPKIAEVFVKADNKKHFKQLLIPCAYYLDSAFRMCGLLAWIYPKQAIEVAKKVSEFRWD